MMNFSKNIPNFITLLNLLCGCIAIVFIGNNNFEAAFYLVCLGIFFDFFDGFFARLLNVTSPLGLQLDSLADMVTSGVVPGYLMYKFFMQDFGSNSFWPYIGFIITLGACFRLANFNIDIRQGDNFIGLPTPANALFFMSIPLWITDFYVVFSEVSTNFVLCFLLASCFVGAYIMNAELPLFSLKIKTSSIKSYKLQLVFLFFSMLLLVFFKVAAVPLIIIFYVLTSVINNLFASSKIVH
jgi:CDP-diacylglycerol--serine O-phosphatidyltransferase